MADRSDESIPTGRESSPTAPLPRFIGITLLAYLAIAIVTLIIVHIDAIAILLKFPLLRAHAMCAAFGMLGATVAAIRKYYQTLITFGVNADHLTTRHPPGSEYGWSFYYLTRPILGGIMGALVYMLTFISVQILAKPAKLDLASEGRMLLYALAFVSGYAVSNVLNRVEVVSRRVFRERPTKRKRKGD
jgi:hypothetical protein